MSAAMQPAPLVAMPRAHAPVWTEAELARLEPLARQGRVAHGAAKTLAREMGRSVKAVHVRMSRLRAELPAPARPSLPDWDAVQSGRHWSAEEIAALLPLVRSRRARRGELQWLARRFGRTSEAVKGKLHLLRGYPDEELAAWLRGGPPMREAPRATGSGPACLPGWITSTAAVQAPVAPRAVSSAAGAQVAPAMPYRAQRAGEAGEPGRHRAELLAAHPPEQVQRRCVSCRRPFEAPSRFRFRCNWCLHRHAGAAYTGIDT